MREMVAEAGPCSELTACLVPLPLKPEVLLEGLLPQVSQSGRRGEGEAGSKGVRREEGAEGRQQGTQFCNVNTPGQGHTHSSFGS